MKKLEKGSPIRSFVQRTGRMSAARKKAYGELKPLWSLPFQNEPLDCKNIYPKKDHIVLEIGFGMGEATYQIARNNPDKAYLALEVHTPGVAKLLDQIKKQGLENIRIIEYDAFEVVDKMIPHGSLSGIHIFFPDPWPKKKHKKRRLIKEPFITDLAERLKPGGYVYAVTDWEDYAGQILDVLESNELLENQFNGYAEKQGWRPLTNYEKKGLEKSHRINEILFIRK